MYRADEKGLIFHTGSFKPLSKQIQNGAPAEACFNSDNMQVRVSGVAEVIEDMALKKEMVASRPFMQPWIKEHGYDLLVVFRITQCEAAVWTIGTNFEATTYQKI